MTRVSNRNQILSFAAIAAVCAAMGGVVSSTSATPTIRNAFTARYPSSTLVARTGTATGNACYVCHQPPSTSANGNCYKNDLLARLNAGRTAAQAVADLDRVDSDGDGVVNGDEILLARVDLPGQVGYNPGLIGATGTDPCADNTSTPVTGQLETPPPPCTADFNADGVVDFFDYLDFVDAFSGNVPSADFNADGVIDFFDYLDFVDAFAAGC